MICQLVSNLQTTDLVEVEHGGRVIWVWIICKAVKAAFTPISELRCVIPVQDQHTIACALMPR